MCVTPPLKFPFFFHLPYIYFWFLFCIPALAQTDQIITEPKFPLKKYNYVQGRNYRTSKKPNEQFLPCDDEETERLQVNHLLFKTGPGWWLTASTLKFPRSHFTGSDVMIYPINWEIVLPELIRVLKPGGYVELVEPAGAIQDTGPNMSIWMMRLTVSLQSRDINIKIASQLDSMLEAIGKLDKIEASHHSAPVGWYGKHGDIMLEAIERLFDATKPKLCEDWSMSSPKYDKIVQAASAECRDFKSWLNIHYTFGRKARKNKEIT
ncbi:hypothetical protein BD408DRAFT_453602 [Parasitella parasitica]|nr:hypothetical protein BD408DRAFT_453602 [Parasitella parasitica]